jgi:hypothetical protein
MRQTFLHCFQSDIHHWLWGRKIRIADLKANDPAPTGFQCRHAVIHCDSGRLAKSFELSIEVLHTYIPIIRMKNAVYQQQSDVVNLLNTLSKSFTYPTQSIPTLAPGAGAGEVSLKNIADRLKPSGRCVSMHQLVPRKSIVLV